MCLWIGIMTTSLDTKMLTGFTREVHSYLPEIRKSIASVQTDAPQGEGLEEALRYARTIKGAAALVGLSALSHMAAYVEATLDEIVTGQGQGDMARSVWLHYALDQLEQYMDSLLADDGQHGQAIVTNVVQAFRRFKSLPAADDAAAVAAILAGEATTLSESESGEAAPAIPLPSGHSLEAPHDDTLAARNTTSDGAVRQDYGQGALAPARLDAVGRADQTERYVLFKLAGSRYAVSVPHVLEIDRVPSITPVPNVPTWLRGIVNVRGDILSVIDFRAFLGCDEPHQREQNRMLVVKARSDEIITSLVVDQVLGIVPLSTTHPDMPTAPAHDKAAPYLNGVHEHGGEVYAVFDLERFLLSPAVRQFE
jgi:purine-binding chemotaxis protein CheW